MAIKSNLETIGFISSNNLMFVTSQFNRSNLIQFSQTSFVPAIGKNQKVFSSDDVLFSKSISVIFPYFKPDDVDYIELTIEQKHSKKSRVFGKDSDNNFIIDSYLIDNIVTYYIYINIEIPSGIDGKFLISGEVKFNETIYGNLSKKYIRYPSFIPKINIQFSSTGPYVSKNKDGIVKSNVIAGHSADFNPVEYGIVPFEFDGEENNNNLAKTITFNNNISKVENNSYRKNIHFNFQPNEIPLPIFQSNREDLSVELDTGTLLKSFPGISYSILPDNNGTPRSRFYLISNPGDWEFWVIYGNLNYKGNPTSDSIRPFIVVKNNARFTNSIVVIDIFNEGTFRREWEPGFTDSSNFWLNFKDDENKDFYQKVRDTYLVDILDPFSSTGTGIETNVLFKRTPNPSKPEEYLTLKLTINVSNNDFFDLGLEVTNLTSEDFKFIGFNHGVLVLYSYNLYHYIQGTQNINRGTKNHCNVKYKDGENNAFGWNVPTRIDNVIVQNGFSLGEVLGSVDSSVPPSSFYIPTNRKSKSENEIKPQPPFTTEDPRNDPRFLESENDPRWFTGPNNAQLIHDLSDPEHNWPYINPLDSTDKWYMTGTSTKPSQIEPFIVFERESPGFDEERGVLAIVAENPYAMYYTTDGDVGSTGGILNKGAANEYKTKFGILSGISSLKAKSREVTRTRFFYDTVNSSREAWYSNVFPNIDFDTNYGVSKTSGPSTSFKNNIEIVVKSAINDRTNIQDDVHFKIPYTYIDNDDISFVVKNSDGTVIPGAISLLNNNIGIYTVQKTNLFYLVTGEKGFDIHENVYSLSIVVTPPPVPTDLLFTEDSTIKQIGSGATAFVIKEIVDVDNPAKRILFINKIIGKFKKEDNIIEVKNFNNPPAVGVTTDIPIRLIEEPHTILRFIRRNSSGGKVGSDNIFSSKFDRPYSVVLQDVFGNVNWPIKTLKDDIFKGGFFNYSVNNFLSVLSILGNGEDILILKGDNLRKKIKNLEKFAITLFNPDEIILDFSINSYRKEISKLQKFKFSKSGSIIYNPIFVFIEENRPTEISASVRDNRSRFGGISKKITLSGESLFEFTGIVENTVRILAYIMDLDSLETDTNPVKIPLNLGGQNLDTIIVPDNLKDRILYLDVAISSPAENVRAKINRIDGTSTEVLATASITNQRFIINVNQSNYEYKNIEILFDVQEGSGLDVLGLIDEEEDVGGISLEEDVITKTGYKAIGYNSGDDAYSFDGFEAIKFTDKSSSYDYRLAFKFLSDSFKNNAIVHTNLANFWKQSGSSVKLFSPPYSTNFTKVKENIWIKSGPENLENFVNFNNSSNLDFNFYDRFYFVRKSNFFYTRTDYANRGNDEGGNDITNLVILYRIDLHHLLDFLPNSLFLPKKDFTPSEKATYDENFRQYISQNFFFIKPTGETIGIASQNLINYAGITASNPSQTLQIGDDIIYPINYSFPGGILPIGEVAPAGLIDNNSEINIKVANHNFSESYKGLDPNFILLDTSGTGGILGTIYYTGDFFLKDSFINLMVKEDLMMHPFLGHTASGSGLYYGVGVKKIPINYGLSFGIILRYIESF